MSENKDNTTIFLQVMAHDLLAPLTAIKWQTELLHKNFKNKKKREAYLNGIESSTELGISIAKNTHVASKVLSETYKGLVESVNISKHIEKAVNDLRLQYERHGLILEKEIEVNENMNDTDTPLLELYVWAVAKFFLTVTPPNNTVVAQGKEKDGGYTIVFNAPSIPQKEALVEDFHKSEAEEVFDQKFVFIELIKKIAPLLKTNAEIRVDGENLLVLTTFS